MFVPASMAQQNTTPAQTQQADRTSQDASACYDQINAITQDMNSDGFWVTGWGNRYGGVDTTMTPNSAAAPWTAAGGDIRSPRAQIRELYGAAQVLGYQGDIEGCQYLLSIMQNTYENYVMQLTEAGVQPDEVGGWRQEQIALAEPVQDMEQARIRNFDDLTGTEVRNFEDENLGSVSDLILDPSTGQLSYAIVARGGFLGFGEDYVAVPWQQFRATPGLNTLVLDTSEDAFDEAPTVDVEAWGDPTQMQQQNQQVDQYWSTQHASS